MKKSLSKILALTFAGSLLMAGSAMAVPFGAGNGASLQNALNERTVVNGVLGGPSSVNVQTDILGMDATWQITATSGSFSTLMFEFGDFAPNSTFGIYDATNKNNTLQLFDGAASTGSQAALSVSLTSGGYLFHNFNGVDKTFATSTFGYYLKANGQNMFYSDTALNSDGFDHMLAYRGKGDAFSIQKNLGLVGDWTSSEYVLAWEDLTGGGDRDFNDFAVMVESVKPTPEPASMLLLGTGLAGLAGARRRKKAQK